MFKTPSEALKFIADQEIAMVDLKVAGIIGQWLHITIPARNFTQRHFELGVGFDGSSGAGFTRIEQGDISAVPDPSTAFVDPFWDQPTLSFICDAMNSDGRRPHPFDPRSVLRRALFYMAQTGVADQAWMGPEFEFHIFDRVELNHSAFHTRVRVVSAEAENHGHSSSISSGSGYMRVPPAEQLHNLRSDIALTLEQLGIAVRYHHHEVGAAGQCEIEINLDTAERVADHTMVVKYVIKNVARRHGKIATFMPKPLFGEPGNGMHVHQKLQADGVPIFYDHSGENYAGLSDTALHYIGGLLHHGRALTALTNPSTNSFKRLVEGYEAPVNLFFSLANRSAAIRIPAYAIAADEKRIEYRPPDFTCNAYLAFAAMLMAGLDGIAQRVDVEARHFGPFDVDIARQDQAFKSPIAALPRTLSEALEALRQDHDFLLKGEVFDRLFIEQWLQLKQQQEVNAVAQRPHPHEYQLYLDT